jgi:hypothetical protein
MARSALQQHILDNIDNSGYGGESLASDKDKLQFLAETFKSEYGWAIARYGVTGAMKEWLSGLPSSIHVPFYNHDILEKAEQWGMIDKNATDDQQYEFLEEWFWTYAREIHKMMREFKVRA